jgi:glycine amidinotransferase
MSGRVSEPTQPVVSSWDEWSRLEEVIVGCAAGSHQPPLHPGELAKVWDLPRTQAAVGPRPARKVRTAEGQLDNFCRVLAAEGVTVRRPEPQPTGDFKTPYFESASANGFSCPRDTLLVVGHNVIEAPTSWRSRVHEAHAYRGILMEYLRRDPGMQWTAAPPPALGEASFRPGYEHTGSHRADQMRAGEFVTEDWQVPGPSAQ